MLSAGCAPLISWPQTEIDVWLGNLSADVLISGTYVKPLFVMQLREWACQVLQLYTVWEQRAEVRMGNNPFLSWGTIHPSGALRVFPKKVWRDVAFSKLARYFSPPLLSLFGGKNDPGLPPDLPPVMTVVHHFLSAAASVRWCRRPVRHSFPSDPQSPGSAPRQGN